MGFMDFLGQVNFVVVMVGGLGITLLYYIYTSMKSKRRTGKGGSGSVIDEKKITALIIDSNTNTIEEHELVKFGDNLYGSTKEALFLAIPSNTKPYIKDGHITYIAYKKDLVALPIDVQLASDLSMFTSTKEYSEFENEENVKALRKMFELQDKVKGNVIISDKIQLAVAFNVSRMLSNLMHRTLEGAGQGIRHFFKTAYNIDRLKEYIEALAHYEAKRKSWIWLVGTVVFLILLGVGIVIMISKGGGVVPHR